MRTPLAALAISCMLLGCGLAEKAEQLQEIAEAAQERLESGDSAGALGALLGGGESVQPVDFRNLKELLPEQVAGMDRQNASGEKSSMMGLGTSKAEGRYRAEEGNRHINVSIMDFGSMRGITMMGFSWTLIDIDNESENGYERTVKYKGNPAYVKYEQGEDWSRGEMTVLVAERFALTVKGNNVSADEIEEALDAIDLGDLEEMKDVGVGEAPAETPDFSDFRPPAIDTPEAPEDDESSSDQPESMSDVLTQMNEGQQVDPIDFRELREYLPEELTGMPRANAEGEKGGAMGIVQSSATGTYEVEGDTRTKIVIRIKDMGNLKGAVAMAGYPWMMMQTDKESDTGFERTTTYEGYPAFESYSTKGRPSGKIQVVVEGRFAVEVEGRGVEWELIRGAIDAVDVDAIAQRKDDGVTPAG